MPGFIGADIHVSKFGHLLRGHGSKGSPDTDIFRILGIGNLALHGVKAIALGHGP
jgi:hypothetical protein